MSPRKNNSEGEGERDGGGNGGNTQSLEMEHMEKTKEIPSILSRTPPPSDCHLVRLGWKVVPRAKRNCARDLARNINIAADT